MTTLWIAAASAAVLLIVAANVVVFRAASSRLSTAMAEQQSELERSELRHREELLRVQLRQSDVEQFVRRTLPNSAELTSEGSDGLAESAGESAPTSQIMRELHHTLNTSLTHVEIVLDRLLADAEQQGEVLLDGGIARAMQSIELSRGILDAYRRLTERVGTRGSLGHSDLPQLVEASFEAAAEDKFGGCQLDLSVPVRIDDYDNYYLAALILPLVENAIEASPASAIVSISHQESASHSCITLANKVVAPVPDIADIRARGFTTKGRAHGGLGICSVETLLGGLKGSSLRFMQTENDFVVEVILVRKGVRHHG